MIALYRKGNTHIINDVSCEMRRFKNKELSVLLSQGWKVSPEELAEKKANKPQDDKLEPKRSPLKKAVARKKSLEGKIEDAKG